MVSRDFERLIIYGSLCGTKRIASSKKYLKCTIDFLWLLRGKNRPVLLNSRSVECLTETLRFVRQ